MSDWLFNQMHLTLQQYSHFVKLIYAQEDRDISWKLFYDSLSLTDASIHTTASTPHIAKQNNEALQKKQSFLEQSICKGLM